MLLFRKKVFTSSGSCVGQILGLGMLESVHKEQRDGNRYFSPVTESGETEIGTLAR